MVPRVDEVQGDIAGDIYPPDPDDSVDEDPFDDGSGNHVPIPRAAQVRARAIQAQQQQGGGTGNPPAKLKVKGGQRKFLAQQKRKQALELRKGGATFDQIAQALNYKDASGARKAVKAAMDAIPQEAAEELKVVQVERYNHMLLTLWSKVQIGDERAINSALAVMDRLNDITGLRNGTGITVNVDASTHENAVVVIDGNKDDYIAAMKRMVGVNPDGTNIPQIDTTPAPAQPVDSPVDVIEAVVIDSSAEEAPVVVEEAREPVVTKKTFNFGVDPTVKRGQK